MAENLLESELFGHDKGAFTGATRAHRGLFQAADGGTLMLDEIGDMPPRLQVKLLRVLQENVIRPVGTTDSIPVNVRVISATHRDLQQYMTSGQFREDLYYRLNVVHIEMPPLNRRREDIPLLVAHFLAQIARESGVRKIYAPEAVELLATADWPGNIRQLQNVVRQNVALSQTPIIPVELVQQSLGGGPGRLPSFDEARDEFTAQLPVADPSDHRRQRQSGCASRQAQSHRLLQTARSSPADAGRVQAAAERPPVAAVPRRRALSREPDAKRRCLRSAPEPCKTGSARVVWGRSKYGNAACSVRPDAATSCLNWPRPNTTCSSSAGSSRRGSGS